MFGDKKKKLLSLTRRVISFLMKVFLIKAILVTLIPRAGHSVLMQLKLSVASRLLTVSILAQELICSGGLIFEFFIQKDAKSKIDHVKDRRNNTIIYKGLPFKTV